MNQGPFSGPRVRACLPLGFAAGLPLLLTGSTLSARLASEGVDLRRIGLLSLCALPYSLKFLWAPLLDRYAPLSLLGRRRGWLVLLQPLVAAAIALLGAADPHRPALLLCSALVAFLSATEDIVLDAYRTDVLLPEERAAGSASYVLGYRAAMATAGALALVFSQHVPWAAVYGVMAALSLLLVPFSLWAPAPPSTPAPTGLTEALRGPLSALLSRPGAAAILAGVALYKIGETLVLGMLPVFLLAVGYSLGEVGVLSGGLGLFATLLGTVLGGVLVPRLGLRRSLLCFGAAQAAANLAYLALHYAGPSRPLLLVAVLVDNSCGGLASTAFVAYLMGLCDARYSATQYALLSSLAGVLGRILGGGAGYLALALGWPGFFVLTVVVAIPGLIALGRE